MKKTLLGLSLMLLAVQAQATTLSWNTAQSYKGMIVDSTNSSTITAHIGTDEKITQKTLPAFNMVFSSDESGVADAVGIEFFDKQLDVSSVVMDGTKSFTQSVQQVPHSPDLRSWVLANVNLSAGLHTIAVTLGPKGIAAKAQFDVKVSEVPVPAAVWLFGSALAGLMGVGKRKKAITSSVA